MRRRRRLFGRPRPYPHHGGVMRGVLALGAVIAVIAGVALADLAIFPHTMILSFWLLFKILLLPAMGIIAFGLVIRWLMWRS